MSLLSDAIPVKPVLERQHSLLEGPRIAGDGALVYSDVIAGGLYRCAGDEVSEIVPRRRGIGGVVAHADGGWVLSGRTVLHLAPDGAQRELLDDGDACGYNDLGVLPGGEVLAGVLRYRPLAGEEARPGRLVAIGAGGAVDVLSEEIVWPNGIGVAPAGERVYVSDYSRQLVLVLPSGGGRAEEFARAPRGSADGLALDAEGGVWVALGEGGGVARFDAGGELDEVIELPASFVSSISFGGPDMCDVLISTADNTVEPELGGTLLKARSEVAGLPVAPASV